VDVDALGGGDGGGGGGLEEPCVEELGGDEKVDVADEEVLCVA